MGDESWQCPSNSKVPCLLPKLSLAEVSVDLDAPIKYFSIWKCCTVISLIEVEACPKVIGLESTKMQKAGRMGMVSDSVQLLYKF